MRCWLGFWILSEVAALDRFRLPRRAVESLFPGKGHFPSPSGWPVHHRLGTP